MKLLEEEHPRVIIVVGAGVSEGATGAPHASWLGLLKHGVDHLVATKVFTPERREVLDSSLDAAFSQFNLEQALLHAGHIEQCLKIPNEQAFADWLAAAFRDLKVKDGKRTTLNALRELQRAGALLLTTNYDSLLSDATDLPPVTWEEYADFLQVTNRKKEGILHIHGHWQHPTSVVLGRSSYDRVVADQYFQAALTSLWLHWSWVYVGCGDGLDDPNLGRLLEWGKGWGQGTMPDYFLAKADKAAALQARSSKPANLVCVGYPDYPNLPDLLHSLTPAAHCLPFDPVDEEFQLFRSPGSAVSVPFPSQQEYLDGEVPALQADNDVQQWLTQFGWAFVLDVASVGKTTLALRMATSIEQRNHPVYYLDLAKIDVANDGPEASAAMRRLSRPNSLLILDNVHHQPELGRQLWDQWRNQPRGSRLLLIATRTQRSVITAPAQDLAFFSQHAIELRPQPCDLGRILECTVRRMGIKKPDEFVPPPSVLLHWHEDFGSALGAFCLAALSRLQEFHRSNWELPPETAADWVREKWLKYLSNDERENVLCLAAFGAQELELPVANEALPHPGKMEKPLQLGLVGWSDYGQFAQYRRFSLLEPGWGQLILAAQPEAIDTDRVLLDAAARHLFTAVVLSSRLQRSNRLKLDEMLRVCLAQTPDSEIKLAADLPLATFMQLVAGAKDAGQHQLVSRCWKALESEPNKFADSLSDAPLQTFASFIDTARQHGRDIDLLWKAIEAKPEKLIEHAWDTALEHVASFLDAAKRHKGIVDPLWSALESEPQRLASRIWETQLGHVASFFKTSEEHGRDIDLLWKAIECRPEKIAECAWKTQLGHVAAFLKTAERQNRDVDALWNAIEREPKKLAECARKTPLHFLGTFFETANHHNWDSSAVVEALEIMPERLVTEAKQASVANLAGFCHHAPDGLVKIAFSGFQATDWEAVTSSQSMAGGTWVAYRCGLIGREDLELAIIETLLRRANPRDFPQEGMGLANIAWMLKHTPLTAGGLVPEFLDKVCSKRWLELQFKRSAVGPLASGLRLLALNQAPAIVRRFLNPALGFRLANEFFEFAKAAPDQQSQILQFFGCATLCGWRGNADWFRNVSLTGLGRLPVDTLAHKADTLKVDAWQFQLWLGLRATAFTIRKPLQVPAAVVDETLRLWRVNLSESQEAAALIEQKVNLDMVKWLERCSRNHQGFLVLAPWVSLT
jgi:hypothetical protein